MCMHVRNTRLYVYICVLCALKQMWLEHGHRLPVDYIRLKRILDNNNNTKAVCY